MMKVRLLATFAGQVFMESGSIQDLQPNEANSLIEAGYAEPYEEEAEQAEPQPVERAINPEPERAERRLGKGSKKRR